MTGKLNKLFSRWERRGQSACLPPWEREEKPFQQLEQQRNFAQRTSEVLNADGMSLTIFCGGQSNVGVGLTGTWVGTASFYGSTDGLNFFALSLTPFASGTAVTTATANGNYFTNVKNLIAIRVTFTRTSGSLVVIMAAAIDSSWQDAFATAIQIANSSSTTSGTNTLTQAAQANRAWNLTFLEVSIAGLSFPGGVGQITVYDGAITGNVLYKAFLTQGVGSVGTVQKMNLPTGADGNPSVKGTPGNAMTIVLSGLSSQASVINTNFTAA